MSNRRFFLVAIVIVSILFLLCIPTCVAHGSISCVWPGMNIGFGAEVLDQVEGTTGQPDREVGL